MTRVIRPIRIEGDIAYVTLTRGYVATIDAADVHLVEGCNWCVTKTKARRYAMRGTEINGKLVRFLMHRVILDVPVGIYVDHREGIGLDNRRSNLRTATPSQNNANAAKRVSNKSGFKGVVLKHGRYRAQLTIDGHWKNLGQFSTPEEAHEAYWVAAQKFHGEFARRS